MRWPPSAQWAAIALSLALAISVVSVAAASARPRPNVLFFAVDDLGAYLNSYGHPHLHTPNFDRLKAMGTQFNRAYVSVSVCAPSRTAFLTGLRPDTTRVWTIGPYFRNHTGMDGVKTLPQLFRDAGYNATGAGKIFHIGTPSGGMIGSEARRDSAEHCFRSNALHCTATARVLIPAVPCGSLTGMNGPDGITGIFSIPGNADKCSAKHGLDQNALHTCAHGDEGAQLYYDSVWAYSDLIAAGKVSKYDAPDIPVVHINGVETKGLDAYFGLGKKLCASRFCRSSLFSD